jgi:uncharacterized protein (TIGR02246 family)
MKTPTWLSTIFLSVSLACLFGTAGAARQDAARADIEAQSRALMAAIERGDAAAVADLFTPDAKLSVSMSGGVISGRAAIANFWQAALDGGVRSLLLTPADHLGEGDVRVETGTYRAFDAARGELGRGQYLFAWVKVGGAWKISRDFANADATPVAPAAAPAASPVADGAGLPAGYATRFKVLGETMHDERHGLTTVYANELVAAVAGGEVARYPDGSVILMEFAEPRFDGEDQLLRDGQGKPLKGPIRRIDLMRRVSATAQSQGASRAGDWEFASFRPDGTTLTSPANADQCAACHLNAGAEKDFVFRRRSWVPVR